MLVWQYLCPVGNRISVDINLPLSGLEFSGSLRTNATIRLYVPNPFWATPIAKTAFAWRGCCQSNGVDTDKRMEPSTMVWHRMGGWGLGKALRLLVILYFFLSVWDTTTNTEIMTVAGSWRLWVTDKLTTYKTIAWGRCSHCKTTIRFAPVALHLPISRGNIDAIWWTNQRVSK